MRRLGSWGGYCGKGDERRRKGGWALYLFLCLTLPFAPCDLRCTGNYTIIRVRESCHQSLALLGQSRWQLLLFSPLPVLFLPLLLSYSPLNDGLSTGPLECTDGRHDGVAVSREYDGSTCSAATPNGSAAIPRNEGEEAYTRGCAGESTLHMREVG